MTTLAWALAAACVTATLAVVVVRIPGRVPLLPVGDGGALDPVARRTRLVWLVLAGALVLALLAFALRTRVEPRAASILPPHSSGVIVIDLSSSTRSASKRIASALLGLVGEGRQFGLVVFSDTAYEALPPSAPVESLRDWLRLFAHDPPASYPWTPSFSGGTWISSGLVTARRILRRDGIVNGHVILISDLVDGPSDLPNLQSVVAQYQREQIALTVIAVRPASASASGGTLNSFLQDPNATFVERAAVRTVEPGQLGSTRADRALLIALIGLIGLLAAVHELALHPFSWRARP